MKKNILIAIFILSLCIAPAFAVDEDVFESETQNNYETSEIESNPVVQNSDDIIFRSSVTDIIHAFDNIDTLNGSYDSFNNENVNNRDNSDFMPLFKQMRIKLTNKYRQRAASRRSEGYQINWKFWQKNTISEETNEQDIELEKDGSDLLNTIDSTANIKTSDTVELEGSVNEERVEKELQLDAENIAYDDNTGEMIATGRPVLFLPAQQTKIIADTMTYDDQGNILKANGNVVVIKNGNATKTDYLVVNMNEETIDADNINADFSKMTIDAQHGTQKDGLLIFEKGKLYSDNSTIHRIASRMVGPDLSDMIIDEDAKALFFGTPEHSIDVKVSSLEIDARKNHDVIKAKNIQIGHNGKYFFKWPSMTTYTNKNHDYFEGNNIEFGSQRKMGMFIGPGFAFSGPFGSVIKVIPAINYKKEFGIGGIVKYINTYNRTMFGYGTARENFILQGRQQLDDDLFLHYGYNSYMSEWFNGARMPKYMAELVYNKSYAHKDFLGDNRDMVFSHRASFGFMKDDNENFNGEKFDNNTNFSTTRTKYMAEIYQSLYQYENKDNRVKVNAGLILQGSGALYGNGNTQFIARGGPSVRVQYKNWVQDLGYYLSGYHDESPLPHFDAYRYGSNSFRLVEALRVSRYLTVAWQTYVNVSNDSPNGKSIQENAFLFSLGPDDFKVILGYDFIRERTYLGFNIAFNPKGTTLSYDRMVIKNPEKLGPNQNSEVPVTFVPAEDEYENEKNIVSFKKSEEQKNVLKYAQVIELEDPDKERID